ncbi:MAG: hypothetical protein ABTQ34_05190 [Bdellovibrionales bacterium]
MFSPPFSCAFPFVDVFPFRLFIQRLLRSVKKTAKPLFEARIQLAVCCKRFLEVVMLKEKRKWDAAGMMLVFIDKFISTSAVTPAKAYPICFLCLPDRFFSRLLEKIS